MYEEDEIETYEEEHFKTARLIGKILRAAVYTLSAAVFAILLWRVCFSTNIPNQLEGMIPNAALTEAMEMYPEGLSWRTQEQATVTRAEDSAGLFGIPVFVFVPEADQVQVILRYNNSTLKRLAEDYGFPEEEIDKSLDYFDVTLSRTTDLTPDNDKDDMDASTLRVDRYRPTEALTVREETLLYTYYRFVFDGVRIEPDTDGVFIDVYYNQDIHYEERPYGTLCLYDCRMVWVDYELTARDKKALGLK